MPTVEPTAVLVASLKLAPAWINLGKKRGYVSRRVPHGPNKKMHWAVKHKWTTAWKTEVNGAVLQNKRKMGKLPLNQPIVEIILAGVQTMDRDNAYAACKPIIDGLKVPRRVDDIAAGVIIDDDEEHLDLIVRQIKVRTQKEEGVTINIYENGPTSNNAATSEGGQHD